MRQLHTRPRKPDSVDMGRRAGQAERGRSVPSRLIHAGESVALLVTRIRELASEHLARFLVNRAQDIVYVPHATRDELGELEIHAPADPDRARGDEF